MTVSCQVLKHGQDTPSSHPSRLLSAPYDVYMREFTSAKRTRTHCDYSAKTISCRHKHYVSTLLWEFHVLAKALPAVPKDGMSWIDVSRVKGQDTIYTRVLLLHTTQHMYVCVHCY